MPPIVRYIAAFIIFMHGLVHVMYFVSYWPLAELEEPHYKTTLLYDRWDVGPAGIRLFGLLCLIVTIGFVIAAVLSLILNSLDFNVAYGGPVVNILILLLIFFAPRLGW